MLPKLITAFGIACAAIGLSWAYLDYDSDFTSKFFNGAFSEFLVRDSTVFGMTLVAGIVLSAGGTLAWAHHLERRKKLKLGGWIFITGLFAMIIAGALPGDNVHGPIMLVVATAVYGWMLSVLLTIIAVAKRDRSGE